MSRLDLWQWVHYNYGDDLGLTSGDDDYVQPSPEDKLKFQAFVQSEFAQISDAGSGDATKASSSLAVSFVISKQNISNGNRQFTG